MSIDKHPDSQWLKHEFVQRKIFALVVTACTFFLLACLLWPLSVTGYSSTASVPLDLNSADPELRNVKAALQRTISACEQDGFLQSVLASIGEQVELTNTDIAQSDLESIRQSISVAALETDDPARINLELTYNGVGTADEKAFVQALSEVFSKRLLVEAAGEVRSDQILASISDSQIDRLQWLVSQIDNDIQTIRESVESIGQNSPDVGKFRTASHSTARPIPTMLDIQNALASIDVKTVHDQINELGSLRSHVHSYDSYVPDLPEQNLVSRPIGGVPTIPVLILLVLFSILVGSVVSINYQPFEDRGFENVSRLARALRIPVVAVLPTWASSDDSNLNRETNKPTRPWANQAVGLAKLTLLGLLILTIGFCLIDEGVREAFWQNPFFGFSKMVWMFAGY